MLIILGLIFMRNAALLLCSILVCAHYTHYSNNVKGVECVFQGAPQEKLLVFSVKEGWEPLCKFLEKQIPDKPFPWKNIGGKGQITKENIQHFNRKIMMELLTFLVAFLLLLLAVYFYANENDWWKSLLTFLLSFVTWYKFLLYS